MTILPLLYLGSIEYYYNLINQDCIIEQYSNYQRQTNTNRCTICTANGIQALSIPIEKTTGKTQIKDTLISYDTDWQTQHWRAIESAYNSAAFFEYFKDEFHPFYKKRCKYLIDFNLDIQKWILEQLDYNNITHNLSKSYIDTKEINKINAIDLREYMQAKKNSVSLHHKLNTPYYQVFGQKTGFIANMSIIDLLFNIGMESRIYLKK